MVLGVDEVRGRVCMSCQDNGYRKQHTSQATALSGIDCSGLECALMTHLPNIVAAMPGHTGGRAATSPPIVYPHLHGRAQCQCGGLTVAGRSPGHRGVGGREPRVSLTLTHVSRLSHRSARCRLSACNIVSPRRDDVTRGEPAPGGSVRQPADVGECERDTGLPAPNPPVTGATACYCEPTTLALGSAMEMWVHNGR